MKKDLAIISAIATNGVIGKNGSLAWLLPADLKRFKELTTDHTIIMGRQTYETCVRRALPHRQNIVITHNPQYHADGCLIVGSLSEAIAQATDALVFIIGGATIYSQAFPLVETMYITDVHAIIEGDVYFPPYDTAEWTEISHEEHKADEKNPYDYTFRTLKRRH